jgi:predicted DNA-binding protein
MKGRSRQSAKLIQTKVFLPPDLVRELDERSKRLKLHKSELVRQAIASFLSADASEQFEAALAKRLDRLNRGQERLERELQIASEALALFIRAWLSATPAAPDGAVRAAMEAKGRERYAGFIDALGRRVAGGRTLLQEVLEESRGSFGS